MASPLVNTSNLQLPLIGKIYKDNSESNGLLSARNSVHSESHASQVYFNMNFK